MPTWAKWLIACGAAALAAGALAAGGCAVWASGHARDWHVEHSIEIAALPGDVAAAVADLRRWPEWSAWARDVDEGVVREYTGAGSGAGARMSWRPPAALHVDTPAIDVTLGNKSDSKSGQGEVEILSADASGVSMRITYRGKLVIAKSEQQGAGTASSYVELSNRDRDFVVAGSMRFEPLGAVTRVVWREDGDLGPGMAAGILAVSMLPLVERQHSATIQACLEGLKSHVERAR